MKKLANKDIIQHYLLNLFTILNVEFSGLDIENKKKKEILDLINVASVIIANENIFSGEKPNFFFQTLSLNDIISITGTIFSNEIESNGIDINYSEDDIEVKIDKYYFGEAFKHLFQRIIQKSKRIQFFIDQKNNKLTIEHDGISLLTVAENGLTDIFKKDNLSHEEILFQLALEVFKLLNIKTSQEENNIILEFN